jgi:intracellular sulfur oxidation DsrE/DsrF family protein
MNARFLIPILATSIVAAPLHAQQAQRLAGPVIRAAGDVFDVPNPDFPTPLDMTYRVAFEISEAAESPSQINTGLATVARFLNMHARAGVPKEQLQLAVVIHGTAGKDVLDNGAYRERTGVDNPNATLVQELALAGVQIILCGQTAASRGLPRDHLADHVQFALSAMTALAVLQERGYHVNPF